jgi:hypothetical protein
MLSGYEKPQSRHPRHVEMGPLLAGRAGILPVLKRVYGWPAHSTSIRMPAIDVAPSRLIGCSGPLADNPQTNVLKLATRIAILNVSSFVM